MNTPPATIPTYRSFRTDAKRFVRLSSTWGPGAALLLALTSHARAIVPVPNGDFELAGNNGSIGGAGVTSVDTLIGSGPWRGRAIGLDFPGPIPDLNSPLVTIGSGRATMSGLTDINVIGLGLINNSATVYNNNLGTVFELSTLYTLTVQFSSTTVLTPVLLADAGVDIELRDNGTEIPANPADKTIQLLDAFSGTFTLSFIPPVSVAGHNIGVALQAGKGSGLANLSALGNISWDNVTLTTAFVPESTGVPLLIGTAGLAFSLGVRFRRERRQAVVSHDPIR